MNIETTLPPTAVPGTPSINIARHRRFFYKWISPLRIQDLPYDRERAEIDFKIASRFVRADKPADPSKQVLLDDINRTLADDLLKESDGIYRFILATFRRAIVNNVIILSILSSLTLVIVAVVNMTLSASVDFYSFFWLSDYLPAAGRILDFDIILTKDSVNRAVFGCVSTIVGLLVLWFFYHGSYSLCQSSNGHNISDFILEYLATLRDQFRQAHINALQTLSVEMDADEMRRDAGLWVSNLQWMALRALFIESYTVRYFRQVRRESSFYVLVVPMLFAGVLISISYIFGVQYFNFLDANADLYQQNTFYPLFLVLVIICFQHLRQSMAFIWRAIESRPWVRFRELNFQDAITEIMNAYVTQLDRWRSLMKDRSH